MSNLKTVGREAEACKTFFKRGPEDLSPHSGDLFSAIKDIIHSVEDCDRLMRAL